MSSVAHTYGFDSDLPVTFGFAYLTATTEGAAAKVGDDNIVAGRELLRDRHPNVAARTNSSTSSTPQPSSSTTSSTPRSRLPLLLSSPLPLKRARPTGLPPLGISCPLFYPFQTTTDVRRHQYNPFSRHLVSFPIAVQCSNHTLYDHFAGITMRDNNVTTRGRAIESGCHLWVRRLLICSRSLLLLLVGGIKWDKCLD